MRTLAFILLAGAAFGTEPDVEVLQQEAIRYAEQHARTVPGAFTFRVVQPPVLPPHRSNGLRFEPSHLSKREPMGRFFAAFRAFDGARLVGTVRVDLEGSWKGRVLQTRCALARKSVPGDEVLEWVPMEGTPPPGALAVFPAGHRLRNALPAGRILCRSDVEPIPLVSPGERVRLEVVSGNLKLSAEALARGSGVLGDRVRLELPGHKAIQAVVTGEGTALLRWE